MRKIIILLGAISISLFAGADWKVSENNEEIKIEKNGYLGSLSSGNASPKVIKEITMGNRLIVLVHNSTSGTSVMLREIQGVIFDKKTKKYLGTYPFQYQPETQGSEVGDVYQPTWTVEDNKVRINDKDLGVNILL